MTPGDTIFLPRNILRAFIQLSEKARVMVSYTPAGKMESFFETTDSWTTAPSEDLIKKTFSDYRVHDLKSLVNELKRDGVTVLDSIESYEYGKFVHILDNEGNKLELWEPVDTEYDKIENARTK